MKKEGISNLSCSICKSHKTEMRVRNGRVSPHWHLDNGKRLCNKCYMHTEKYKECQRKHHKKYNKIHPDKRKVWLIANKIRLIGLCQNCNINKAEQRHHSDYSKPLEVVLLCSKCHREIHKGAHPEK